MPLEIPNQEVKVEEQLRLSIIGVVPPIPCLAYPTTMLYPYGQDSKASEEKEEN